MPTLRERLVGPKSRLLGGSFLGNVAVLAGGTAAAQVISVVGSPVLTRIYAPADYGVAAVFTSILGLIGIVSSLSYQVAIPLPKDDQEAANVLGLALVILVAACGLLGICVSVLRDQIAVWTHSPPLSGYLWLLPPALLLSGSYQVLNYWALRKKAFDRIANTRLSQSVGYFVTSLAMGLLNLKPLGLIVGGIANSSAGVGSLAMLSWRQDRDNLHGIRLSGLRWAARRYAPVALLQAPNSLLNALSVQLPTLVLSSFFAPDVVGHWALTQKLVALPITLVGASMGQVYFSRAAEAHRDAMLGPLTLGVFTGLFSLGLVPCLVLSISGPDITSIVLGAKWVEAGRYLQWLGLWMLLLFVSSPLSLVFTVTERLSSLLMLNVALLVTRFLALYVGGVYGSPRLSIALLGASGTVMSGLICLTALRLASVSYRSALAAIGTRLLTALPFVAVVLLAKLLIRQAVVVAVVALATILVWAGWQAIALFRQHPESGA